MAVRKTNAEIGFENLKTAKNIEKLHPEAAFILAKTAFSKFKDFYGETKKDSSLHGKATSVCSALEACTIVMRTSAHKYKDVPIEELNLHVGTELEFASTVAKELGKEYPKVVLGAADVYIAYLETVELKMKDTDASSPQYAGLVKHGITQSLEALKIFDWVEAAETSFIPLKIMDMAGAAIFFLEERQKVLNRPAEQFSVKDRVVPEEFAQQFEAIKYSLRGVDGGINAIIDAFDGRGFTLVYAIPSDTNIEALRTLLSLYGLAYKTLELPKDKIAMQVLKTAIEKCTRQQSPSYLHKSETVNCFVV